MIFGMCCISFKHERAARKVVAGFQNLLPESCVVIRDGKEQAMSAEELVNGDIILIKNGTRVPADARVIVSFITSKVRCNNQYPEFFSIVLS